MKLRKHTLLTFDAFGTLIVPREPIARQYADAARSHGLSGFTEDDVARNFRTAFKEQSRQNPNYGKATGMGAAKWWANVGSLSTGTILPWSSCPGGLEVVPGRKD